MSFDIEQAFQFAFTVRGGFLATAVPDEKGEHPEPRVRGVLLWYADSTGFYFHTSRSKELFEELRNNPRVEVAFVAHEPEMTMLRIRGHVEFVEEAELKERLLEERPWLKNYGDGTMRDLLAVFRIVHAKGKFWTQALNMKEREIPWMELVGASGVAS